jgi:hypothetical protein
MVTLTSPVTSKGQYFDRNPIVATIQFSSVGTAPHSNTIRQTYTVPTLRKALVQSHHINLVRATVATTPGNYTSSGQAGGLNTSIVYAESNVVGAYHQSDLSMSLPILAGATASMADADASIGGTVDIAEVMVIMEFDA